MFEKLRGNDDEHRCECQEEFLRAEIAAQQHALEPVEDFIQLHDGQANFRRPILAIVRGTPLGKSVLAGHVLRRFGERLSLPDFLKITVEDSELMNLAEFHHRIHSGVILDGVGDAGFLKRHRETVQGRPKVVKGAKSATNVCAYSFFLRASCGGNFRLYKCTQLDRFRD